MPYYPTTSAQTNRHSTQPVTRLGMRIPVHSQISASTLLRLQSRDLWISLEGAILPDTAATPFPSHAKHLCDNTRPSATRRTQSRPWCPFYGEPKFQVNSVSSISGVISFSGSPGQLRKYSPIRELSDDISMSHLPVTWRSHTETPRQREEDVFGLGRTCAWAFPMACHHAPNLTLTVRHVSRLVHLWDGALKRRQT